MALEKGEGEGVGGRGGQSVHGRGVGTLCDVTQGCFLNLLSTHLSWALSLEPTGTSNTGDMNLLLSINITHYRMTIPEFRKKKEKITHLITFLGKSPEELEIFHVIGKKTTT